MASYRASTVYLIFFIAGWLVDANSQNHHDIHHELHILENANVSTNISLVAPYYRNVSGGAAWTVPYSVYNLGARDMRCECFNPDETCCMPNSKGLTPFCIPKDSICCSNTFCNAHETCCVNGCCKSDTTCTDDGTVAGCCPSGKNCSGSATCYDQFSSNCITLPIDSYCCPPGIPFCRNFYPSGFGCYASSIQTSATKTSATTGAGHASDMIAGDSTSGVHAISTTTTATEKLITVTETIMLEVIGSRKHASTLTQTISLLDGNTSTSVSNSTSSHEQTTKSSPIRGTTTTTTTVSTSSPSTTTTTIIPAPTTPSSSKSPLCFNADSQSPVACTPSPSSSPSSSDDGPSIPGQIILRSQAASSFSLSRDYLLFVILSFLLTAAYCSSSSPSSSAS